jgi:hypothetical protein
MNRKIRKIDIVLILSLIIPSGGGDRSQTTRGKKMHFDFVILEMHLKNA